MAAETANRIRAGAGLPAAGPRLLKTAIAAAVSLGVSSAWADAVPRNKIRLAMNDEISSRVNTFKETSFDGRYALDGLIQSHPDPLFVELEERYQALPPFTQAQEAVPEQYIVEASTPERLMAGVRSLAGNVSQFVPTIRSAVRYDDITEDSGTVDETGNPLRRDHTTALATINPTFMYETQRRKWAMEALYDYERGHYFIDEDSNFDDHVVNLDWTIRMNRGQELIVTGRHEATHDRRTRDPIEDFDSSLEATDLDFDRSLINVTYRNGSPRDRSRFEIFALNEYSSLDSEAALVSDYDLNRKGIGTNYAWRIRKQLSLVADASFSDFDYDLPFRDNNHIRFLVGAELVVARRIRAALRVGYAEKTFDNSEFGDSFSEPVWNAKLEWALRRTTSVGLETAREIYELATIDRPIDVDKFNVQDWVRTSWRERWSTKFSTETSYTYRDTRFEGRDNNEDAQQFLISAIYQFNPKLRFAIDGAYTKREDDLGADISRRTFTFRTEYSL